MDELIKALKAQDWFCSYSDDIRVYREGRAAEQALEKLYIACGRPRAIWNEHCPKEYQR